MFVIILPICFVSIFLFLFTPNKNARGLRDTFLKTSVIFGSILVICTESFSFFKALTVINLFIFWSAISFIFIAAFFKSRNNKNILPKISLSSLSKIEIFYISIIFFIAIMIGLIAFICPPNTFDSLTYHMTRVAHWAQDKGVFNYPTKGLRQLAYNPGAEYMLLHIYILGLGDAFVNFLQWFCMIGCILGTSLIAKELGASKNGQIFTSVLTATIPMGIIQASGTQNDYVASFWLICLIHFLFSLNKEFRWDSVFFIGASLGLGILTKGTIYIFSAPFLIWSFLSNIKNFKWKILKISFVIIIITLIINIAYYTRNYDLGKNPITPTRVSQYLKNETINLNTLISNTTRNIALHLNSPFKELNQFFQDTIISAHKLLKIDPDDPRTTFGESKFYIPDIPLHEDHAGNLLHMLYGLICIAFIFISKDLRSNKKLLTYISLTISSFLLFSLLLKWQPWNSRLQLPLFVASCAFIGIAFSSIKKKWITNMALIILIILSMPRVFKNSSRRMISSKGTIFNTSRLDQYFNNNEGLKEPYKSAVSFIKASGCKNIGFSGHGECWEYPIWALLKQNKEPFRMESVNVNNESLKYASNIKWDDFTPCAIINATKNDAKKITAEKGSYIKVKDFGYINIFLKDNDGTLEKQTLIKNLIKTLSLTNISTTGILSGKPFENFTKKEQEKIKHFREEIEAAELVDTDKLNEIYPSLGDHFKEELLPGIKLRAFGYINSDINKYKYGYALTYKWNKWRAENNKAIERSLKEFTNY